MKRANPFDDLSDFTAGQQAKPVEPAAIEQIAQQHGFLSRPAVAAAPPAQPYRRRRFTTGRNQQINIKATPETIARLYRMADARPGMALGELLDQALDALERSSLAQQGRGE